jgi:hypothetical protein
MLASFINFNYKINNKFLCINLSSADSHSKFHVKVLPVKTIRFVHTQCVVMPLTDIPTKCHMSNLWVVIIKPKAKYRFCMAAKLFYIVQTSYFSGILYLHLRSLITESTEVSAVQIAHHRKVLHIAVYVRCYLLFLLIVVCSFYQIVRYKLKGPESWFSSGHP